LDSVKSTLNEKKIKKERKGKNNYNMILYLFLLPAMGLVFVFSYIPLPGLIIGFLDYDFFKGFSSSFIGLANFAEIFRMPDFINAILNTLKISILNLFFVFPLPIAFALMLNEIKDGFFKRFTQTVSYLPHFLSTIAVIGIATTVCSEYGIINDIRLTLFGVDTQRELFLTYPNLFIPNVIILSLWQSLGWSSIIYLSAISGIDTSLYEAAIIDGAGKLKQCIHITIPSITPTVIMLFILQIGNLFKSNFDLIYGLQNVFVNFEVISTMIFKQGITNGNYSIATAFGFLEGAISLFLVLFANWASKKVNNISII